MITPEIPVGCTAVHAKVAPDVVLVRVTKAEVSPEQMVWLAGEKLTVGLGFTVIVNDSVGPEQLGVPLEKEGVTVIVAVIGLAVELLTLNSLIVPEPDAANPIAGFEFVQLKVVVPPVLLVEKATADILVPLHKI